MINNKLNNADVIINILIQIDELFKNKLIDEIDINKYHCLIFTLLVPIPNSNIFILSFLFEENNLL